LDPDLESPDEPEIVKLLSVCSLRLLSVRPLSSSPETEEAVVPTATS